MLGTDDPERRPFIKLNSKAQQIGKNLWSALWHLRLAEQHQLLWIVAMFINQADTSYEERNHQVQLMSQIYSDARNVLVWLGPATEDIDRAIKGGSWFTS